jgi:UDP-glucose 4-epimerase
VCRALTGQDIEVYGDGQQISDMVYVQDGALALVKALECAERGDVFDTAVEVGPAPQDSRTVNQVAQAVIDAAERKGFPPVALKHLPMRPGEIPGARVSADVSTLALVGMSPDRLVPLGLGLRNTVDWFEREWLPGYLAAQKAA